MEDWSPWERPELIVRIATLHLRSLEHYWPVHVAAVAAVAVAATVLTGALMVGDSMRAGLRDAAVKRLGPVDHAMIASRFFTRELCERITADARFTAGFSGGCPCIITRGSIQATAGEGQAERVQIVGVDASFSAFWTAGVSPPDRMVALSRPLAERLGVRPNDEILLRLPQLDNVSPEMLLGRRDRALATLRVQVAMVLPDTGPGQFSLEPSGAPPLVAFVDLATLQRTLKRPGQVNTLLVRAKTYDAHTPEQQVEILQQLAQTHADLADYGLTWRDGLLKSSQLLISPPVERAAVQTAALLSMRCARVLVHLADSISLDTPAPEAAASVPYSVVAAVQGATCVPALAECEIILTDWTANELHARRGDAVRLSYRMPDAYGVLRTESALFKVRDVLPTSGIEPSRGWVPDYSGITGVKRIAQWDPPFPVDMQRIRPQDEAYWERYGPTPKAFIALSVGQRLWSTRTQAMGSTTCIEVGSAASTKPSQASPFAARLLQALSPASSGMVFRPVKSDAIAAAAGSTDFSQLFLAFSFFLIVAASMLVALVYRLGVEQRAPQIGLLLATGFSPRSVLRLLLTEGLILSVIGSLVGAACAAAYAQSMLHLLHAWMPPAVNMPALSAHVLPATVATGVLASLAVAMAAVACAVRGLARRSPRALLAGLAGSPDRDAVRSRPWRATMAIACGATSLIFAALGWLHRLPEPAAFFGAGAFALCGFIAGMSAWARSSPSHSTPLAPGWSAVLRLGMRHVKRNPARSTWTVALLAFATFVIVAVGANRKSTSLGAQDRRSGAGGFSLVAESTIPLLADLNSPEGRDALNLSPDTRAALQGGTVVPLRLRSGDNASCTNLYRPRVPRILGATDALIQRGGFAFAASLAVSPAQKENPWLLLRDLLSEDVVPAIADENTAVWLLHSGLGRELTFTDDRGRPMRLRLVALLSGSILQGELVIAESAFRAHFPGISGYSFFLIDAPPLQAHALQRHSNLPGDLAGYGLILQPSADRLAGYLAIEDTYLTAFESLGGLGMILGALGLAAVLARNVLERRRELALLQAVGYARRSIAAMLLVETTFLMMLGLIGGTLGAALAAWPQWHSPTAHVAWASLAGTLGAVFATATLTSLITLACALRRPLIPALRND